jgi:hypothetical protein
MVSLSMLRLIKPITSITISSIHVDILESPLVHQEAVVYGIIIFKAFTETMVVIVVVLIVTLEKLLIVGWTCAFTHFLIVLGYQ